MRRAPRLAPFQPGRGQRGRSASGVGTGLALVLALAAGPAPAQVRASLDAGVSHVEYDRFLPSAAFSLSPALRVAGERLGFAARGTWLTFESGNSSVQGLVAGSLFLPASPSTVAEVSAELGGSRYEGFAQFSHLLGRARLLFQGTAGSSGSLAATAGVAALDSVRHAAVTVAAALRLDRRNLTLTLTGTGTAIGEVAYADLEGGIRHARPGGIEAEAVVSARAGDPGGDPGPYVEATLTFPVTSYAGIVLGGGRYAEDAVRGNIAGRYVTAALRVTAPLRRRSPIRVALPDDRSDSEATVAAALIELRRGRGNACTLIFRVLRAGAVEIMADFTDWLPAGLEQVEPDLWRVTLPIAPGRHRLNLRVNGGPWGVPAGTTSVADDFQGLVGAVVVP
ncbi:MAG: hypothetical protein HYW52_08010 [Gemmatimonadetes bacterium]|nr:hypothetical protein [Gemmatimonadota bacterium]